MTKKVINIGTTANDGTGDTLRDAMSKANDNFTELYARQGPVSGSLFPDVINAVKYFEINDKQAGDLFCITEIKCAVANGSDYDYMIEISKVSTISGTPAVICTYSETVGSLKSGLTLVTIPEDDGSGYAAKMVINWSLLTAGTDYQMPDYEDGSLFAVNVTPLKYDNLDSKVISIPDGNNTYILDGSAKVYNRPAASDGNQYVTLAAVASCVGDITITNDADQVLTVYANGSEEINGLTAGTIVMGTETALTLTRVTGGFKLITSIKDLAISSNI